MLNLDEIRKQIDEIDKEMAALFERRMQVAADVAAYKRENNMPVLDAAREEAVVQKNVARLSNQEMAPYYEDYLRYLMGLSRQYQAKLLGRNTVAYQGAEGSFQHTVAKRLYPHADFRVCPTFADVFDAVENGNAMYGVVPFENSTTGDVSGVLDLCYSHNCYVVEMVDLPVMQNLLGLPAAKLADIKTVYSHEQGLEQSKRFLQSLGVQQQAFANTALAAKHVAEQGDVSLGAIASLEAGALYGLVPLAKDINTEEGNTTRFIIIAKEPVMRGNHFSLLVTIEDGVGVLSRVIQTIAKHRFDMECIKSRPMPKRPWEYYFYIELVGDVEADEAQAMLQELETVCLSVKMLGVYARMEQNGVEEI